MDLKLKKEKGKEGEIVGYLQLIPLISAVVCVIGAAAVCIWQLIVAPCWSQKLLAVSVIVPIGLGAFNMWKYFNSTKEFDKLNSKVDKLIEQQDEKLAIDKERREDEKENREKARGDRFGKSPF